MQCVFYHTCDNSSPCSLSLHNCSSGFVAWGLMGKMTPNRNTMIFYSQYSFRGFNDKSVPITRVKLNVFPDLDKTRRNNLQGENCWIKKKNEWSHVLIYGEHWERISFGWGELILPLLGRESWVHRLLPGEQENRRLWSGNAKGVVSLRIYFPRQPVCT